MLKNIIFALKPTLVKRKILLNEISNINKFYLNFSINYNEDIPAQFESANKHILGYSKAIAKLGDGGLLLKNEFIDVIYEFENFISIIEKIFVQDTSHWHKSGIPNVVPKDSLIANYDPFKNQLAATARALFVEHILGTTKDTIRTLHLHAVNYKPSKDLVYRLKKGDS
tara:strand:- start:202 stop:708 length:507 start_codon:yes stop_codon:yes gene_type:complete